MRQLLQWARRNPDAANAIFTALLGAILLASMVATSGNTPGEDYDARAYVLFAACVTPLLVRRRFPLPVLAVTLTSTMLWYGLGYEGSAVNFPMLIALYTAGLIGNRRRTVITGVVVGIVILGGMLRSSDARNSEQIVAGIGWSMAALFLGEAIRTNRQLVADYHDRALRAETERELLLERRLAAERVRIAQELHDLMAHTITTMTVQAGVAADALDDDPDVTRQSLQTIRAAGREATREVKATVALLRQDGDRVRRTPMPGLADVAQLVERAGTAGLRVDVTEVGDRRPLPAVIELTAYRVVQEALTNVARHAGTNAAAVELQYGDDALVVEITNNSGTRRNGSAGSHGATHDPGYGLLGMAERAAAIGGSVTHGTRPGGGYRVWARLPIGSRQWRRT